jgi:transcriptional regulator with XRE-family HTH domain
MNKFGSRIEKLREQQGLSQEQLAERVGIGRGSISHIENNRRTPSLPLAARLAKELGVTLDALLGTNEKVPV